MSDVYCVPISLLIASKDHVSTYVCKNKYTDVSFSPSRELLLSTRYSRLIKRPISSGILPNEIHKFKIMGHDCCKKKEKKEVEYVNTLYIHILGKYYLDSNSITR